ncbi:MAG: hypothetical protein OXF79_21375 [Chloroflexi bacterium]|nr:hypothetical protein [Chloroflexota bacterium]
MAVRTWSSNHEKAAPRTFGHDQFFNLARTHFVFYIDAQDEQDLIDYCERSRALDDAEKLNAPPARHHPVDPVYRCKFAPVVVKLGTREILQPLPVPICWLQNHDGLAELAHGNLAPWFPRMKANHAAETEACGLYWRWDGAVGMNPAWPEQGPAIGVDEETAGVAFHATGEIKQAADMLEGGNMAEVRRTDAADDVRTLERQGLQYE